MMNLKVDRVFHFGPVQRDVGNLAFFSYRTLFDMIFSLPIPLTRIFGEAR